MKIGIDGRPLQEKFGGVKEFTLNMLHALFCLDQKNEYHIFYNSHRPIELPDFTKYPNVHIHRFHWPNKLLNLCLSLFNWPKLDQIINRALCHPDPANAGEGSPANAGSHTPASLSLQRGEQGILRRSAPQNDKSKKLDLFWMPNLNFVAFSPDFKYILTIHDLSFCHFPEFFPQKHSFWHKAIHLNKLLRQAEKIITVSEHSKNDIIETFKIAPEKIEVIYPPINQNITGYSLLATGYEPYILYLGTLEPRKNIEGVIEAYKILKTKKNIANLPKLIIAGPKGWKYKTIFSAIDNSIKDDVIFKNQVSQEEKVNLYKNAKLFVFPSFYEGFGLPPLEAASFGVPVIASSASSLPEVLADAAFYVNPWNVTEIAEAMALLLNNNELRQKLSLAGQARAQQFQTSESAEKLLRIFFEEVVKR